AGALPIIGQHAVGLEREQVLSIELLRVLERTAGQADGGQREGAGPEGGTVAWTPGKRALQDRERQAAQQRQGTRSETELEGVAAGERHVEPPSERPSASAGSP